MSKAAKDGNNFRREWDIEAFEKKAKERLDAELALEREREEAVTVPAPIVQRAPLQRRTEDLKLAKFVGARQVISGADALSGQYSGAYFCKVCDCALRDSSNYLAHINGKKHNRMLGMSMRAERSTVGEVKARLEAHKEGDTTKELAPEEKAALFLEQFDDRLRAREEEARLEAAEERRAKRARRGEEEGSSTAACEPAGSEAAVVWAADPEADDMAAAIGFGGFGGSKKN
jgi:U4/U6.U5 tri-snRNP component SNU23